MRFFLYALCVCTLISLSWGASLGYCRKASSTFATANSFESSSFDPTTNSLFFGTKSNNPRIVYKLNTQSFPTSTSQQLVSSNDAAILVSLYDPARDTVYFAGGASPGVGTITRVQASTWTEIDSLSFTDQILSGVIDTTNGYVYFGTFMGKILKIDISNFTQVAEIATSTPVLTCAIQTGEMAYFGSFTGSIHQINITSFTLNQTLDLVGAQFSSAVMDSANSFGYFATMDTPEIFKIDLSNMNIVGSISLSLTGSITSMIIDTTTSLVYVGTSSDNELSYVIRVNLSSFAEEGSILLESGESFLSTAEIDEDAGLAFFGCSTNPGIIVEMQLTDPEQCQHSNCSSCNQGCSCGWCANRQQCLSGDSRGPFGDSCTEWDYNECPCENLHSCAECSLDPRCGWCDETQKCERGNTTHPFGSTCSQWSHGSCVPCNQTTCGACTADDRCGWCSETQTCTNGNASFPYAGTCQNWDYGTCPCEYESTCASCSGDARCGWCSETQTCKQGNSSTPHAGSCQVWNFPVTCSCDAHTDCGTCTADNKCGWCAESNSCFEGNSSSPYAGSCQAWDFESCPCAGLSDCASCSSDSKCGWCASSQTCLRGNSSSPFSQSCPEWDYDTCPCVNKDNCTACTSQSQCGWCESSLSCLRGNSSSPVSGSCSNYLYSTCPVIQTNCSAFADCETCTPSTDCVWCASSLSCVAGNSSGPSSVSCPSWSHASCPAIPVNCSSYNSNCTGCTADSACGWCESSLECIPSASNSTCVSFFPSSCPMNCSGISSCGDCAATTDCGWCESKQTCESGNSTRNFHGSLCPDWSFSTCPLPPQSNCTLYTNCSSCAQFTECGWCETSQTCVAGNLTGDSNQSCSTGWHYASCPVQCGTYANCSSCSTHSECGWCESSQTCSQGNTTGPTTGSCPSWRYATCENTGESCVNFNSCSTCVPNSACGWCPSSRSCISAALNSTCIDWQYSSCGGVSPQFPVLFCSNFTTLSSCISARAEGVECGWCERNANGNHCLPGNISQPSNTTCGNSSNGESGDGGWYFEGTCGYLNCSYCTANPSCGWCESSQQCVPGNSSSAIQYSCPSYFYSTCVNCSRYSNCSECNSVPTCSWCNITTSNGECVSNTTCPSNNTQSCEIIIAPIPVPPNLRLRRGLSAGAIAGIILGALVLLAVIAIIAFIVYTKKQRNQPFKPVKVTKKNEEIVLDEIVPNTASMIVSASPNLATTGFGTPGKPVPPLSPGSAASKYLLSGPGSAGEYPSSPSPSSPSPSLTPNHSPALSPHSAHALPHPLPASHHASHTSPHHSPHQTQRGTRRDSSHVLKTPKTRKPPRVEEPPVELPPKKPPIPTFSPKVKHISTGPIPKSPPADPANKYAQLDRLLQLPPLEVAAALLEVTNPANSPPDAETIPDQQSFDAAVQALVIVLASDPHKMALLFEWALAKDVNSNNTFNMNNNNNNNNNNEPDVLFGESSTSAALARIYFPIIGGPHLANGLGSMILDICSHPAIYKDQVPAATHRILDTIQISINQSALPEPLFHLLQTIESLVGMKFSLQSSQLPLIATTFLLRHYYIAALLRPRNFGFIPAIPSVEARQVLNDILDHVDRLWFESSENLPEAVQRASSFSSPPSSTPLPPLFTNCEIPKIDSTTNMPPVIVREAALAEIHRLLDEFIDDISNFMGIPLRLFQQDILPREGEEPFDVLCAVVSAQNPDPLPLLQQILAPDLACLLALFEQLASKPDESDELALAAVHVFESYGQTHRLLTAQITNEAKTTLITSNIFKPPTSVGLRIASYYMKIAGSQYLLPTFKNMLFNMESMKDSYYEIDKQKVSNADQLPQNRENVIKLATECLNLVLGSIENIPYIDRKIYRHMHLIIGKYASHEKSHDALIRLFIDGLIVPSLIDPKGYGLLDEDPKPRIHKGLFNVAKIIQATAYALPFAANHPFSFANSFIQNHSQTLQDFVDSLAQQAKRPVSLPPPVPISEELHRVSVACLHHYLTTYINNADYCYCYMKHSYFHRDEAKTDKSYEKDLRELFFRSPIFYELVVVLNNLGTPPLEKQHE